MYDSGIKTKSAITLKMEDGYSIKRIRRSLMTLGEYNNLRGWNIPDNEDPKTDGYLIEYLDGGKPNTDLYSNYISWSPKDVCDDNFSEISDVEIDSIEVKHDLLSNKYTSVHCEPKNKQIFNAPHHFMVKSVKDPEEILSFIDFQCGPIKVNGVNGVMNEDLLIMVLERLNCFQESNFRCRENSIAITKIEEALLWLRKRTMGRERKGIEGTHKI